MMAKMKTPNPRSFWIRRCTTLANACVFEGWEGSICVLRSKSSGSGGNAIFLPSSKLAPECRNTTRNASWLIPAHQLSIHQLKFTSSSFTRLRHLGVPLEKGERSNFLYITPKFILIFFLESTSREELKSVVFSVCLQREGGCLHRAS